MGDCLEVMKSLPYKRIGADSMKNKNNLDGNKNISEKTCSFIYFKSDYDRTNKKR